MINFKYTKQEKLICPHIQGTCPSKSLTTICEGMGRTCPRKWTVTLDKQ